MTSAEIALAVFAICNSIRVFAYVPQIVAVARDQRGASAISLHHLGAVCVSHLSTVAYALLVISDWRMAAVFVANTLCCLAILGLTVWKRAVYKAVQRADDNSRPVCRRTKVLLNKGRGSTGESILPEPIILSFWSSPGAKTSLCSLAEASWP
jgi:uncharacterized protein with PQ loop repeat